MPRRRTPGSTGTRGAFGFAGFATILCRYRDGRFEVYSRGFVTKAMMVREINAHLDEGWELIDHFLEGWMPTDPVEPEGSPSPA